MQGRAAREGYRDPERRTYRQNERHSNDEHAGRVDGARSTALGNSVTLGLPKAVADMQ